MRHTIATTLTALILLTLLILHNILTATLLTILKTSLTILTLELQYSTQRGEQENVTF